MGKLKHEKVDQSRQHDTSKGRSKLMREKKEKDAKTLKAHDKLLGLIYKFLKQHGYDRSSKEFRLEHDRRVKERIANEVSWENIYTGCPSLVSIFLQWNENRQTDRNKADSESDSSESSAQSDAGSEEISSRESSSLTPSMSSSSSEHDNPSSESELEPVGKKRKRNPSSTSSSVNKRSTSSSSISTSNEDDSDASSQLPAKRPRRSEAVVEHDHESRSGGTTSVSSSSSISSREPTAERDNEDTLPTKSSSDSSQISDASEYDALPSRSSSSDSSSEQPSSESDLDKGEVLNISDLRQASPSVAVKAISKKLNVKEKFRSRGDRKLKGENLSQQRKSSTDSSNTLLGGEGRALIDIKLEGKNTGKAPPSSTKNNIEMGQLPYKRQKTATDALGMKQLRRDNSPFSRIPKDIKVDERFATNLYMPNTANEQVYQDLRLTKGKGFTKEKNKKKRGSRFSGGKIDIQGRETIKFDD